MDLSIEWGIKKSSLFPLTSPKQLGTVGLFIFLLTFFRHEELGSVGLVETNNFFSMPDGLI